MILIVSEQADLTADLVVEALIHRGGRFARLNCDRVLANATVTSAGQPLRATLRDESGVAFPLEEVRAIWYRRPALPVHDPALAPAWGRFAQREAWMHVLGALLALDTYWMSEPSAIWRANHKPLQLARAPRYGLQVPLTCITRVPAEAWEFVHAAPGAVIAKPVSYGNVEDADPELAIYATRLPASLTLDDIGAVCTAPVIFQHEVPKRRDVRVTVVGERVFAVGIESQAHPETMTDWRRPIPVSLAHAPLELPTELASALVALVRDFGLQFSAIDLVERDDGTFVFLELNPNGQWGWLQLHTPLDIAGAIADRLIQGDH